MELHVGSKIILCACSLQLCTGVLKIKICGAVNSAPKRKSVPADDRSAIFTSK